MFYNAHCINSGIALGGSMGENGGPGVLTTHEIFFMEAFDTPTFMSIWEPHSFGWRYISRGPTPKDGIYTFLYLFIRLCTFFEGPFGRSSVWGSDTGLRQRAFSRRHYIPN